MAECFILLPDDAADPKEVLVLMPDDAVVPNEVYIFMPDEPEPEGLVIEFA